MFKKLIPNIIYIIKKKMSIFKVSTPAENLFPTIIYKLQLSDESENKSQLQQIF